MGVAETMTNILQTGLFQRNKDAGCPRARPSLRRQLSKSERAEVEQYHEVYFVPSKRFHTRGCRNGGHDDENSRYLTSVGDHIAYRYEVQTKLGKGAFGDVYQVYDHKTGNRCALKIIRNEHRFNVQGRIEVEVLETLRQNNPKYNYVKMLESFVFRGHLCLTFDLHSHDLYTELKSREFQGLAEDDIRGIAANVTTCLKLLRKLKIVHADLKPENILLSDEDAFDVKVIDFGSSCFQHGRVHTYVQSRYYRSPEIVLGLGYGCEIDMWSLGCIVVELLTGRPIFAAKNEKDLLLYIMEVLDTPPAHLLERATRTRDFFSKDRTGYHSLRVVDRKGRKRLPGTRDLMTQCCRGATANLVDFVRGCLQWDPKRRMTPEEALRHPFLANVSTSSNVSTSFVEGVSVSTCVEGVCVSRPLNQAQQEHMGSTQSLDDSGLDSVSSQMSMSSDE